MEYFRLTDIVCSTHVAVVDMTAQIPCNIQPSPVLLSDMASSLSTDTVKSLIDAADDLNVQVP